MRGNMIDLIPKNTIIEKSDISHLFWRYCQQTLTTTPPQAKQEWDELMDEIIDDTWGA